MPRQSGLVRLQFNYHAEPTSIIIELAGRYGPLRYVRVKNCVSLLSKLVFSQTNCFRENQSFDVYNIGKRSKSLRE